jgi:hypothetical protein
VATFSGVNQTVTFDVTDLDQELVRLAQQQQGRAALWPAGRFGSGLQPGQLGTQQRHLPPELQIIFEYQP